jgi:hypothetical protein
MHKEKITILVNQRPFHVNETTISADEIRGLIQAPSDYEVWKIVKDPDPEGQLPVDDIQITGTVEIKSGERFRVVPPGTFGMVSVIPQQLADEIEILNQKGYKVTTTEGDGLFYLIFDDYVLPKGYNKSSTKLLLKVPPSYPNGNLDMFWTDNDLRLESGDGQANTNEEAILGQNWLRFSWHPQKWNPGTDNLETFLEFVNRRLTQLK